MLEISRKISLPQRNSQPHYIKLGIINFTESLSMNATSTQLIFKNSKNAEGENLIFASYLTCIQRGQRLQSQTWIMK